MSESRDQTGSTGDTWSPLEQALDFFFYAPIGLALNAEEMVGQMAKRGRQSVAAARFIGQMALQQGRTEVDKALDRLQDQAATLVEQLGHLSSDVRSSPGGAPATPLPAEPVVAAAEAGALDVDERPVGEASVVDVNRAIPDYDSLAASQVVPRLAGLTGEELETVRRYEAAHRGRTTVLNRISQLQRL